MMIEVKDVVVADRHRVDHGDLDRLADSIARVGILEPIVISTTNRLICGERRLLAYAKLGRKEIEARVVDLDSVGELIAECDENETHKPFNFEERVAIGLAIEAEIGNRQGQRTDLPGGKPRQNFGEVPRGRTDELAAKRAGFGNPESYRQAKLVVSQGVPELITAIEDGKVAISTAVKIASAPPEEQKDILAKEQRSEIVKAANQIKREEKSSKKTERETKATTAAAGMPKHSDRWRLIHAGVADLDEIEDASVDTILTDPPYPKKYLPVYEQLAETAARVLKPGGSCLVMVGQSYLPEILVSMAKHLTYHWTLAYLTPGGQAAQVWQRRKNTFWKPVLWLVKGTYEGPWAGDVASSTVNDNDKRFHHWGQSESGMADLIRRCSEPGQTILDPFCGGGTTGVVAVDLDRFFIGADIDETMIATSLSRLNGLGADVAA